jgi:16S rRNA processing protein RimM
MGRPQWIEVGRISRAHGLQGELRILPSSDNPDRFVPGSMVFARPKRMGMAEPRLREQVRLTIASVRGDEDFPIVAFAEVPDRDAAEALRGYVLEIGADQLPELDEDEFYPFDLTGLEVRTEKGTSWGKVIDAIETPAHALLVIVLGTTAVDLATPVDTGDQVLVPFVHEAVPVVSLADGYLVITSAFLDQA